jgi:Bacterial protein of unknown function (DUF899)
MAGGAQELLAKEKEFTRLRDQLSALRRELPWEALTKEYVFEGADGRQTLPQLFTLTRPTHAVSTSSIPTTTSWTSHPGAAMKPAADPSGCAATTNTTASAVAARR